MPSREFSYGRGKHGLSHGGLSGSCGSADTNCVNYAATSEKLLRAFTQMMMCRKKLNFYLCQQVARALPSSRTRSRCYEKSDCRSFREYSGVLLQQVRKFSSWTHPWTQHSRAMPTPYEDANWQCLLVCSMVSGCRAAKALLKLPGKEGRKVKDVMQHAKARVLSTRHGRRVLSDMGVSWFFEDVGIWGTKTMQGALLKGVWIFWPTM